MVKLNENYKALKQNYLFATIAKKVTAFTESNKDAKIIRMGIGDVTEPLAAPVVDALIAASKEMGVKETFKGYGDYEGNLSLRKSVKAYYKRLNIDINESEIFISDGAKSDCANFTDLFSNDNTIIIPDPVYPVYYDSNVMLGRKIVLIDANEENGFLPMPSKDLKGDIIYLCSPNNPTGAVYTKEQLKIWVDFANKNKSVILFDAAYEAFITDKNLPKSIFEIEGAKTCAVEFCSYSKTAGFTGTRCGYTVVPEELNFDGTNLNAMWLRRQATKFNGTSYIVQKGAEVVYKDGKLSAECQKTIDGYRKNALEISRVLTKLNIWHSGAIHSPYIWLKCPKGMDSWQFFDNLLENAQVVGTPGSGFGKCGEGYFRLTAFNTYENTVEAMKRIETLLK